jgi:hypothetical protein
MVSGEDSQCIWNDSSISVLIFKIMQNLSLEPEPNVYQVHHFVPMKLQKCVPSLTDSTNMILLSVAFPKEGNDKTVFQLLHYSIKD